MSSSQTVKIIQTKRVKVNLPTSNRYKHPASQLTRWKCTNERFRAFIVGEHCWTLDKPMASLSTCHLGLWLGWQILLNLVKSLYFIITPNVGYRPRFCYLPAKAGNCEAAISMWYYNCATCACEKFIYGGCGGNRNRFETERACRMRCKAKCRGLVSCDLKCKSGFLKDLTGCPICQCVDACEVRLCQQ